MKLERFTFSKIIGMEIAFLISYSVKRQETNVQRHANRVGFNCDSNVFSSNHFSRNVHHRSFLFYDLPCIRLRQREWGYLFLSNDWCIRVDPRYIFYFVSLVNPQLLSFFVLSFSVFLDLFSFFFSSFGPL